VRVAEAGTILVESAIHQAEFQNPHDLARRGKREGIGGKDAVGGTALKGGNLEGSVRANKKIYKRSPGERTTTKSVEGVENVPAQMRPATLAKGKRREKKREQKNVEFSADRSKRRRAQTRRSLSLEVGEEGPRPQGPPPAVQRDGMKQKYDEKLAAARKWFERERPRDDRQKKKGEKKEGESKQKRRKEQEESGNGKESHQV